MTRSFKKVTQKRLETMKYVLTHDYFQAENQREEIHCLRLERAGLLEPHNRYRMQNAWHISDFGKLWLKAAELDKQPFELTQSEMAEARAGIFRSVGATAADTPQE